MLQYYLQYPKGINSPIATNKWINKMWYIHWMEYFVVVQSLSCVWLFATPWTVTPQVSLAFTIYQSLLRLISIESVIPSSHLILCHPLLLQLNLSQHQALFNEFALLIGQNIGASASVLSMNIQGWFTLGLTDLISFLTKGLSRVFSSTTVQKHKFFDSKPSLWFISHIYI